MSRKDAASAPHVQSEESETSQKITRISIFFQTSSGLKFENAQIQQQLFQSEMSGDAEYLMFVALGLHCCRQMFLTTLIIICSQNKQFLDLCSAAINSLAKGNYYYYFI